MFSQTFGERKRVKHFKILAYGCEVAFENDIKTDQETKLHKLWCNT